ncbi:MAG: Gfo/Idh/MocA family oxidoreductase [Verrucomicrobia bacterium]|jgi:predicted dehydrogenase|nr:Gfo/Idh/MocA family oxidoreductase [Verrucomicrobiota bacterium]|tara:strand:+ start:2446 stop:3492 length:1047 start_codon:yes stop_codon:yes gene_type:complete
MKTDYRIGVLGSGFIVSECHLVSYQKLGYNPVAIASRTKANAEKAAQRFGIETVYDDYQALLDDASLEVLDIAVPPQQQPDLIRAACKRGTAKAILAQKPLALELAEARELVEVCEQAGILLAVNQNMRHDPSVKVCKALLDSGEMGEPVFATIDMRGIPHWQPWQEEIGGASLKIMSIHHLDCMRFWFGDPERLFCSMRPDPRTTFPHEDGICTYVLEYASGLRAVIIDDVWTGPAREGCPGDLRIEWRVEGLEGMAIGDIGWCKDPYTSPSSIRHATKGDEDFKRPTLEGSWFPDAFGGTMGDVFSALDTGEPCALSARDNLGTLALIEAAQRSVREHRAVSFSEI